MPVRRRKWLALAVLLLSMLIVMGLATSCLASEEGVPPFPDIAKIGWTAVNFFLLLAILYKFGFNPVSNMLEERTNTIESSLKHAEELLVEVEQMRKDSAAELADARREAQEIVARGTQIAEETKNEIISKAEVEEYLYKHPAISECAVIGVPHDYRGEDVKAFVVLKPDWEGKVTEEELVAWAREQMSVYKYPRTIEFRKELPKGGTGKILRKILKAEEAERRGEKN